MPEPRETRAMAPSGATASLVLDFLDSLVSGPRPYLEVMEAWRTSCPRLTVWEDAVDCGWVRRERVGREAVVALTPMGVQRLKDAGRRCAA
jgi:hypothetical protein